MKRRVNYHQNQDDLACAVLASLGFSTQAILNKLSDRLSQGQVLYRIHKAGIVRRDYRDGNSYIAQQVIKQTKELAAKHTLKRIKH